MKHCKKLMALNGRSQRYACTAFGFTRKVPHG